MKEISVKALAKVNLGLDVVRKREDGYHEVRMIMQTIHLFDRLEIMRNQSGRITMSTNLAFLPTNENNLVYKAAALLKEEFDIGDGIDVKLHKHLSLIHISEPTRQAEISYAVFCLKKKKKKTNKQVS